MIQSPFLYGRIVKFDVVVLQLYPATIEVDYVVIFKYIRSRINYALLLILKRLEQPIECRNDLLDRALCARCVFASKINIVNTKR